MSYPLIEVAHQIQAAETDPSGRTIGSSTWPLHWPQATCLVGSTSFGLLKLYLFWGVVLKETQRKGMHSIRGASLPMRKLPVGNAGCGEANALWGWGCCDLKWRDSVFLCLPLSCNASFFVVSPSLLRHTPGGMQVSV